MADDPSKNVSHNSKYQGDNSATGTPQEEETRVHGHLFVDMNTTEAVQINDLIISSLDVSNSSTVSSFSLPSTMPVQEDSALIPDVSQEPSICAEDEENTTSSSIQLPARNPNNTPTENSCTKEINSFTSGEDATPGTSYESDKQVFVSTSPVIPEGLPVITPDNIQVYTLANVDLPINTFSNEACLQYKNEVNNAGYKEDLPPFNENQQLSPHNQIERIEGIENNQHASAVNSETSDYVYNLDMDIGANEEIVPEAAINARNELEIDTENGPVHINLENDENHINSHDPIDLFFQRLQEDTEDIQREIDEYQNMIGEDIFMDVNASLSRHELRHDIFPNDLGPEPNEFDQIMPGVQENEDDSRDGNEQRVNAEMQVVNAEESDNDLAIIDANMQDQLVRIHNEMNEHRDNLEDMNMRFLRNLINDEMNADNVDEQDEIIFNLNNVLRQREAALAENNEYDAASEASNNDADGQARPAVEGEDQLNDLERVSSNTSGSSENSNSSTDSAGTSSSVGSRRLRPKKKCIEKEKFIPPPGNEALGNMWANALPDVVLAKLYHHMNDSERLSMAQVCKHWYNTFNCASLWRERYYRFAGVYTTVKVADRAIGYAQVHRNHLKILTVVCDSPTYSACSRFQRAMTTFFNLLLKKPSPCRLNEFYMTQLAAERYWRYETPRKKFLTSLSRFLRSQKRLKEFDMSEAYFKAEDGCKVIDSLGRGAGASLRSLNLEDFFHAKLSLVSCHRWIGLITKFHALSSLYINYCWISEPFMLALSQVCQTRLRHMSIKVIKQDSHHHRIDGETWRTVRKRCPRLKVHLYTEGIGSHGPFRNLMPYELPLKSLTIWTGLHKPNEGPWHLSHTLTYIADCFGRHLQEFSFSCENENDALDESLLYFLNKSRRLQYLDLQGLFQVSTMDAILRMQQQNQLGLTRCYVILENMTAMDLADLEMAIDRYRPMIEERSLDFNFQPSELPFF